MGLMVDGAWYDQWYDTGSSHGKFERPPTLFRSRVETGGPFEPEAGVITFMSPGPAPGPIPPELAAKIDALNEAIYPAINNGVYRAGFATTQDAYEEAFDQLFTSLDALELRLKDQKFLLGEEPTEADWRLFTTLVRFDAVYYGHFKCNRARLVDFPELWDFARTLYQSPGIAGTVRFDQIKTHYYGSHRTINPTGIVPKGPDLDFWAPTRRGRP